MKKSKEFEQFMSSQLGLGTAELWYIASPYTHACSAVMDERVAQARRCVAQVSCCWDNVMPFSPVVYTTAFQKGVETPKVGWYQFDLGFLAKADKLVVLMLDGWKSSIGVGLEIAFAQGRDIPIWYTTVDRICSDEIPF